MEINGEDGEEIVTMGKCSEAAATIWKELHAVPLGERVPAWGAEPEGAMLRIINVKLSLKLPIRALSARSLHYTNVQIKIRRPLLMWDISVTV